ncbi:MAG TPA: cytochrome c [Steroidobacteraceae bacterium]|nr:cytochrome c [Steroidobacteraceae bacterium]
MCRSRYGALALAAGLLACAARIVAAQTGGSDQLIAQGALNYTFYCSSCHGGNAGGNPTAHAPPLAGQTAAPLEREIAALRKAARTTRDPAAASHASVLAQLNGEQIEGIAEYLASLAPPPSAAH